MAKEEPQREGGRHRVRRNKKKGMQVGARKRKNVGHRRSLKVKAALEGRQNYLILPSTRIAMRSSVKKAIQSGRLEESDRQIVIRAFTTAAVIEAQEKKTSRVRVAHFERGWAEHLAVGNCPPHMCIESSILKRRRRVQELIDKIGVEGLDG